MGALTKYHAGYNVVVGALTGYRQDVLGNIHDGCGCFAE